MLPNVCTVLLLASLIAAKQEDHHKSTVKDQDGASDQVTSILVHHGPTGPRHVVLSDEHQINSADSFSSRAVDNSFHYPSANYPPRAEDVEYHHTVPPPLPRVSYGPARPVLLLTRRPAQLYHHRFAARPGGKIPHLKAQEDPKGLSEAIYKYSMYIKHGGDKAVSADGGQSYPSREGGQSYPSRDGGHTYTSRKPDYSYTTKDRDSYGDKPQEGLSAFRNQFRDEVEEKFKESIGDVDENEYEKNADYTSEKRARPLPFSKLYFTKQHIYIPNNVDEKKRYAPVKNYDNHYNNYDDETYHDKPSGFDDTNGGKVVPLLAKFYKQPLPVIQTQLPADNKGLFIQYFHPQSADYDREDSADFFQQYPQERTIVRGNLHTSDSEWTPINAPSGAVPAKSYDIPAPDLSLGKSSTTANIYRRGSDSSSVVVGKIKQTLTPNRHIQGNSEGVVSAVVRVKQ